jgi:hypothetical protein
MLKIPFFIIPFIKKRSATLSKHPKTMGRDYKLKCAKGMPLG